MFRIFSRRFLFSLIKKPYQRYLNDHIKKTLHAVSTPGKIKSKLSCETYFEHLSSSPQSEAIIKTSMNMVFSAAFQLQNFDQQRQIICQMIVDKKISSQSQLDRVIKFVFKEIKWNSLIGQKQIETFLTDLECKNKEFESKVETDVRGKISEFNEKNLNNLCKKYRELFPEIDSKLIYDSINVIVQSSKQKTIDKNPSQPQPTPIQNIPTQQNKFWDKIQNIKPRLIKQQLNPPQIFQQHKAITNGKLRFRFPPQPNGYLHIGHIKSIRMNFQTARRLNGECYLRYDDTNPEKETPEFIEEIQRNVKWMGYKPDKINFTSDYFQHMMYYANQLVKEGKAYVCESAQEEIQAQRKEKRQNPFRMKEKSFSQRIFPHLNPSQTLRLKLDPSSPNPTLRDPIIYRYKHHPHPKTGSKYSIYPMYDFAHCISDSLQHIDYSLCSLQFEIRRQLYYKILDMLGLYKPIVWQFSRLNVTGNVISKRKIKQLIDDKKIEGWDDPRLLTIKGMQRRGYTPKMLNEFIDKVNASRSGNQKYVRFEVLQREMKKELAKNCVKVVALRNPVKVNLNKQYTKSVNLSSQQQRLMNHSHIHAQKQQLQKLSPGKSLILKQAGVYTLSLQQNAYTLTPSSLSIQQLKAQHQKTPILSWLPENITFKKVVYFGPLVDENEQYNDKSRIEGGLWVGEEGERELERRRDGEEKEQQKEGRVVLFERIAYVRRDEKSGELICCAEV